MRKKTTPKNKQTQPESLELTCVLVRPIHELNVGAAARACANFGARFALVAPRCKIGFQTRLYAKHAWPLVKDASVFKELGCATKGVDLVIATTGVPSRFRAAEFKNCVSAAQAALKAKSAGIKRIALVFGSEDVGLSQNEISECDFCAFVPTSGGYAVMNLSHAVAVMLYEFRREESESAENVESAEIYKAASPEKRRALAKLFSKVVGKTRGIRDKRKVGLAFKRVLERAVVAQDEAQALFAEFGELAKTKNKTNSKTKAKKRKSEK
ncbi:MAG: RNA methyltransferase [Candidatus Micrarchaeota archaeon]